MPKEAKPKTKKTSHIKAVSLYSPRIAQQKTIDIDHLTRFMVMSSKLDEGMILYVLKELKKAILHHFKWGRAVKVDSLGTFTPRIALDGSFSISHLPDMELKNEMGKPNWFEGEIKNKDMIGKSVEDLVARWNEEHPDDPIE